MHWLKSVWTLCSVVFFGLMFVSTDRWTLQCFVFSHSTAACNIPALYTFVPFLGVYFSFIVYRVLDVLFFWDGLYGVFSELDVLGYYHHSQPYIRDSGITNGHLIIIQCCLSDWLCWNVSHSHLYMMMSRSSLLVLFVHSDQKCTDLFQVLESHYTCVLSTLPMLCWGVRTSSQLSTGNDPKPQGIMGSMRQLQSLLLSKLNKAEQNEAWSVNNVSSSSHHHIF